MSLAILYSRACVGMDAPLVTVEVHLSNGLPSMSIVGLPETAVKESKDRVRGAILNSQFDFPARRITINLAPADLPKEGGRFDLAIALGVLAASRQIPDTELQDYEFAGELALSGELRPVQGILPMALQTCKARRTLVIACDNIDEATLVKDARIIAGKQLLTITAHLMQHQRLDNEITTAVQAPDKNVPDLADVRGQHHARRALEIAAAGNHSLLMLGPPGTGKSLLASRLPGILPEMTESEALEAAALTSISGIPINVQQWKRRAFRAPHHTASAVSLVGGGSNPRPGEISLAHHGVLFLDELPEFDRKVLEVLREPLESGHIMISRAARHAEFPAQFQLIAAMNPCPCGYLGDPSGRCHCNIDQIERYRRKISGPLLDRIDIHIEVPRVAYNELEGAPGEASTAVRTRVAEAQGRQLRRVNTLNSRLTNREIEACCTLRTADRLLLQQAMDRLQLSARAYHRILKVARTIADLAGCEDIERIHLSEAIGYRKLDRNCVQ
jgi:magnesium chelatase family protein